MSQPYGGIQRPYKMDQSSKSGSGMQYTRTSGYAQSCEILVRKKPARGGRLNAKLIQRGLYRVVLLWGLLKEMLGL